MKYSPVPCPNCGGVVLDLKCTKCPAQFNSPADLYLEGCIRTDERMITIAETIEAADDPEFFWARFWQESELNEKYYNHYDLTEKARHGKQF